MVKNRLIFTLLFNKGIFMLSRNFRLQEVGDLAWIKEFYDFKSIAFSIDELVVINIAREKNNMPFFAEKISELASSCFMPMVAGGGIKSLEDAFMLLNSGADKIIVNSAFVRDQDLVRELVKTFGSQSIIASIDYKIDGSKKTVFIENGSVDVGWTVKEAVDNAVRLGAGEIYLTSMDRDGTGRGYDLETLKEVSKFTSIPIIASGGVGKFDHLSEGILEGKAQAVSTANLFNFMADGLTSARDLMRNHGINLAVWDTNFEKVKSMV